MSAKREAGTDGKGLSGAHPKERNGIVEFPDITTFLGMEFQPSLWESLRN
jgi:hypothetical protein